MSSDGKRFGEHVRDKTRSSDRSERKRRLYEALEDANRELARGEFVSAGELLVDVIEPTFESLDYTEPLSRYHSEIKDDDGLPWHWGALYDFLSDSERYLGALRGETDSFGGLEGVRPQTVIERAVTSFDSLAAHCDITARELKNRVDAVGFSVKLGEHVQDEEMDIGDPVRAVTHQTGALKTLFVGGTGQAKSASAERFAEDLYQINGVDSVPWDDDGIASTMECKILDIHGPRDGENWFYDVPQQQPPLRDIREEMDLPADFTEDDSLMNPELEILAPMTTEISRERLPYDVESESFTIQPYTVPASSLPQDLMVAFVSERLSDGQEETVRSAYDAVDRNITDWSLRDLAEEIRSRDELAPKDKQTAINVIKSLSEVGFIRTRDDDHTLDWREVFESTEKYTVFTQALSNDKLSKLISFAYLFDAIKSHREQMSRIPQCLLVMRELWKIAPHKRRQSPYPLVAALQEACATMIGESLRENRHGGMHVAADTQAASDLHVSVRERFNRYVMFSGNYDDVKDVFGWASAGNYKSFYNTLSARAGEGGVVGQVQPAIEYSNMDFISPLRYAPPSHHHRISPGDNVGKKPDLNGWTARCKYIESEELRRPCDVDHVDWRDEMPPEIEIDASQAVSESGPDPATSPVEAFVDECVVPTGSMGDWEHKSTVRTAFNEFLVKHGKDRWDWSRSSLTTFGKRFNQSLDNEYSDHDVDSASREGEQAFTGLSLTSHGAELLDNATVEIESSASTIQG